MTAPTGTFVCLRAQGLSYAARVECVEEVRGIGDLQPVPRSGADVLGVLHSRDGSDVIPVLDVLGAAGPHVLVLRGADGRAVGLLGEVTGLARAAAVGDAHSLGRGPGPFRETVVVAGQTCFLLDPDRISEPDPSR
ncbi:MAG: chemotaxis protein CheW [Sporichthyaceae bacterium]